MIEKLTEVLSGFAQTARSPRPSGGCFTNEKAIPEFDPKETNLSAAEWIAKVSAHARLYGWDERTTLYMATCRLKGNAKLWYTELHDSQLTWGTFSSLIAEQFPGESNYSKLFKEAANFECAAGHDLVAYSFLKIGKLKKLKLEIPENKLVSCVVGGIQDDSIRTTLMTHKFQTIAELNERLANYETTHKLKDRSKDAKKSHARDSSKVKTREEKSRNVCYGCGKSGHQRYNCPEGDNTNKPRNPKSNNQTSDEDLCGYCKKPNHSEKDCFTKRRDEARKKKSA